VRYYSVYKRAWAHAVPKSGRNKRNGHSNGHPAFFASKEVIEKISGSLASIKSTGNRTKSANKYLATTCARSGERLYMRWNARSKTSGLQHKRPLNSSRCAHTAGSGWDPCGEDDETVAAADDAPPVQVAKRLMACLLWRAVKGGSATLIGIRATQAARAVGWGCPSQTSGPEDEDGTCSIACTKWPVEWTKTNKKQLCEQSLSIAACQERCWNEWKLG